MKGVILTAYFIFAASQAGAQDFPTWEALQKSFEKDIEWLSEKVEYGRQIVAEVPEVRTHIATCAEVEASIAAAYDLPENLRPTWAHIVHRNVTTMRERYESICPRGGQFYFDDVSDRGVRSHFGHEVSYALKTETRWNADWYTTYTLLDDNSRILERVIYRDRSDSRVVMETVTIDLEGNAYFNENRNIYGGFISSDGKFIAISHSTYKLRMFWRASPGPDMTRFIYLPSWGRSPWYLYGSHLKLRSYNYESYAIRIDVSPSRSVGVVKLDNEFRRYPDQIPSDDDWIQWQLKLVGDY